MEENILEVAVVALAFQVEEPQEVAEDKLALAVVVEENPEAVDDQLEVGVLRA